MLIFTMLLFITIIIRYKLDDKASDLTMLHVILGFGSRGDNASLNTNIHVIEGIKRVGRYIG